MKSSELPKDQRDAMYQWLTSEWSRCDSSTASIGNHAITYLVGTNGGGVVAVAAFVATANYSSPLITASLALFLIGLLLIGLGIAYGHIRMARITRELGNDHRRFNAGELDHIELESRHQERFQSKAVGSYLAWASFLAFWIGAGTGGYVFHSYVQDKAAAALSAPVKTTAPAHPVPSS